MIDQNNRVVLIDFDRMINSTDDISSYTKDIGSCFFAPEIINGIDPSCKSDIYSIGLLIYCILMDDLICSMRYINEFKSKYPTIYEIYENCQKLNHEERPDITTLLNSLHKKVNDLVIPLISRKKN